MNGLFQFNGLVHDGAGPLFDYSCCKLPDLDENALDEQVGLNAGGLIAGLGTAWHCGPQSVRTAADANGKIDWNCNGTYDTGLQSTDINGDLLPIPQVIPGSVFTGFDDWAHIKFRGGAIGALGSVDLPLPLPPASTVAPDELGADRAAAFGPEAPTGLAAVQKDDRVEIQWQKPPEGGKDKLTFNVYRLCDGDLEYLGNLKQTKYKDYAAPAASTCIYAVASVDVNGVESPAVKLVFVTQ